MGMTGFGKCKDGLLQWRWGFVEGFRTIRMVYQGSRLQGGFLESYLG